MDSRSGSLAGLYVLVVEDNVDAREILRLVLTYFGAAVATAQSAREGLSALREVDPDVTIADIHLGDREAPWLLREARKVGCRAVFLAVSADDFDEARLREQGFAAYLRKPVDHERLVETVLGAAMAFMVSPVAPAQSRIAVATGFFFLN